jgi:cobalt-zinc-cadmium efflux system outer membrane protein
VEADLIQAGMLKNPVFSLLFPIGPKQLESVLNVPIEFFWQRPYRVAVAQLNAEKVAEDLIQNGLDLIRRVKISFINYNLAHQKARIAYEEAVLQAEISRATSARVLLGDMSELEGTAFLLLEAQIRENGIIFARDARREGIQLRGMLGLNPKNINFVNEPPKQNSMDIADRDTLIKRALAARPDLRAAEIAIESSAEKIGWEKSKIFNISATVDANAEGKEGFEIGPGFQMELPIFNRNEAGRSLAEAEFKKSVINYMVVKQKIITEVLQAHNDYLAAQQALDIFNRDIVPYAVTASNNAVKSFEIGETSYIEFLAFKRQLINARLNDATAEANLQKSIADLEYSVGSNFIQPNRTINTENKE